ncbi:MAG: class I SAM-dependent methyltransferase, partial [Candidatus Omnitrophota bacterium]|nr:class I SAM-dependent methyltransferase [Candidatus Omnitrophota bacterium]
MSNQPIEYKRGYVNFLGCKIDLKFRPMIPRKETAFWLKRVIKEICKKGENFAFLDVFSGSGCIGLAVLKNCSKRAKMGVFSEIDKGFVKQIKFNLKLNEIDPKKYKVVQSDIFKNITGRYGYIFANPPYVGLDNRHLVQESV